MKMSMKNISAEGDVGSLLVTTLKDDICDHLVMRRGEDVLAITWLGKFAKIFY
jgi:hypothetical protein